MNSLETQFLHVEPMRPDTFAPFGIVLTRDMDHPPDYADAASIGWRFPIQLVGSPELVVVTTSYIGTRFSRLERHIGVTQAFIPVGGVPAAVAVGTAVADPSIPPPADAVRAFLLEPGVGYVFHADTWHSLDRYPLIQGSIDVIMLTSSAMTDEARLVDPGEWRMTQEADYRRFGLEFELVER